MVERGEIEQAALITQVVAVTVTLSLVVHSADGLAGHPVAGGDAGCGTLVARL